MFFPAQVTQPENLPPWIPWVHVTLITQVSETPAALPRQNYPGKTMFT